MDFSMRDADGGSAIDVALKAMCGTALANAGRSGAKQRRKAERSKGKKAPKVTSVALNARNNNREAHYGCYHAAEYLYAR
jgi:hypothetical protein